MEKKTICYISYCQDDISQEQMGIFIDWMTELCNDKIEFLFDGNVKYVESFDDFEDQIFHVDSIIIFFSPQYKKKCLEENDTGVWREYRKILNILDSNRKLQQKEYRDFIKNRKIIYSILYKGERGVSITNEFSSQHYIDMSKVNKFCEDKNHTLLITQSFVNNFSKRLTDLLKEIMTIGIEKSDSYISDYDRMLSKLFINTKSENFELPSELFIETDAYNSIVKQQKYLVLGRKGSGKTTVKNTITSLTGDRYKGIISIVADKLSTNETYQLIYKNKKINSDLENALSKIDTYRLIWNAFINIYCIFVVYKEYRVHGLNNPEQLSHVASIERTIRDIFRYEERIFNLSDETVTKTIYDYVIYNLENFIDNIIRNSRNDVRYYKSDIKSFYTRNEFLRHLIGDKTFEDFIHILKYCNKKIFITLDGFDVSFDLFKQTTIRLEDSNERKERLEFENLWLMIFIETLLDIKADSVLSNIVDLCLALPVDRLEAIKNKNRDFYKYHAFTVTLSWNSQDLIKLIAQRLKRLNSLPLESSKDIKKEDLEDIMYKCYRSVPTTIQMERNGYVNMPLFLYMLRKSFWRPRDIIRYYNGILSMVKNRKNMDDISIKRTIKDEAMRIIQDEFLGEFSNLYTNLREVVNLFRYKNQVLSYDELYDILKGNDIIIDGNIIERDFDKKIKVLYIIGFLGMKPPKSFIEAQYLYDEYAFIFTEGTSLLRILGSEIMHQCKFVIHPIFTEYLFLKVDYDKLVCNYTWDYVESINCNNIDYVMYEDN